MQISSINVILPKTNCTFRGQDNWDDIQRRRYRNRGAESQTSQSNVERTARYSKENDREYRTPQPEVYKGKPKKERHPIRNAIIYTLAGATAGAAAGNVATMNTLQSRAMKNPVGVVAKISGAPQALLYEWQINGMTVYPEVQKGPVVSNIEDYSSEQLQNIQKAQNEIADVYYNANNSQYYAVLKKDADIKEIKATFGLSLSNDSSVEKLNYLYDKPTIGADLNTAMLKEGDIVRFSSSEAGIRENFYAALLIESLK